MSTPNSLATGPCILLIGIAFSGCAKQAGKPVAGKVDSSEKESQTVASAYQPKSSPERKRALDKARQIWIEAAFRDRRYWFAAEDIWKQGHARGKAFHSALGRVGVFPRVSVSIGDTSPRWVKVRLNADGARFDAIEFVSPYSRPADLILAFAVPGDPRMSWGITGGFNKPERRFAEYQRRSNLEFAVDLDLPKWNTVIFQQLNGRVITSGPYLIWFAFDDPNPIDVYVKVKAFDPRQEEHPNFTTAEELAQRLGFELPFRFAVPGSSDGPGDGDTVAVVSSGEMPPDMKLTLIEARTLQQKGLSGTEEFGQKLASASSGFAEIPVAIEDEAPRWNRVRLNTLDSQLDAVRFTNPCDYYTNLIWTFAFVAETPGLAAWQIASGKGLQPHFTDFSMKRCLEVPDSDLPDDNAVVFQQLDGGQIAPGQEYYLWFSFETPMTTEVYVKLKLVKPDSVKLPHVTKAHAIAEHLGFELPLRFADSAGLVDHAMDVVERLGTDAGLEFLEKKLATSSDRPSEFYHAKLAHEHAVRLAKDSNEPEKASPYFLKAASSMRALREKYDDLSPEEVQYLQTVVYNEACSLALTGQPEKALESLRQAIQFGFHDLTHILKDEDLRTVRELPAFDELMSEL